MWAAAVLILLGLAVAPASAQTASAQPVPPRPVYTFPSEISLCGEKVPLSEPEVWEALDREFTIAVYNTGQVMLWLKRAGRHFPHIEKLLKEFGLPDDLKYLAVAESDLLTYAYSSAGAGGPWQFIRATASRYGLRQGNSFDDRLCIEKATEAALTYLKDLHDRFNSWSLAMAAYNCGEARVNKEMQEQGESTYFRLNLPLETERYVYRIMAIKVIMSNPERYGFVLDKGSLYPPQDCDVVEVKLPGPLHMRTVASACNSYLKQLKELNPEVQGYYFPQGQYTIKLPRGSRQNFQRFYTDWALKARERKFEVHVVQKGDTLRKIAGQYGVEVALLRKWNGLRGDVIKPGQELRIF